MGMNCANQLLDREKMDCEGTLTVKLTLEATPRFTANPTDIVLALDCSESMSGAPLHLLKECAKKLIDRIDGVTGVPEDGCIGMGSRMALLRFSDEAVVETPLTTSADLLKRAIDALNAGGLTDHSTALTRAAALFNPASRSARAIVLFTDGITTLGANVDCAIQAAHASGIVLYVVGLVGKNGAHIAALDHWAWTPKGTRMAVEPDDTGFEALFDGLAMCSVEPGATHIVVNQRINPDFVIIRWNAPDKGELNVIDGHSLRWEIPALGINGREEASLAFTLRHSAPTHGLKRIGQTTIRCDDEEDRLDISETAVLVNAE